MLTTLAILSFAGLVLQEPGGGFDPETLQKKVDEITPRVAELRGWEFKRKVKAGVHTPEEFLEFAKKEFEEEYGMVRFRAMSEAYGLLGLIDPSKDLYETFMELLKDQVGGYYDPKTETFYMISTFSIGWVADIIMAHELTHALDDQHFELDAMFEAVKGNSDHEFAVRAVTEGSGTSLMNLYTIQGAMKGWLDMTSGMDELVELMEQQTEVLEEAPPYLIMSLALPYLEGNKFLTRKDNLMAAMATVPTAEELDRAFREPPTSSEQVLHPEKYWDPEQRDEPTPLRLPDLSAQLGGGWERADQDVLGELGCFVLTSESLPNLADPNAQMMAVWTNPAAAGWDGDLYQYYRGPDGARLVLWATVWDTEADRDQFADAMETIAAEANPMLRRVDRKADAVTVYFANDKGSGAIDVLRGALLQARPDWK